MYSHDFQTKIKETYEKIRQIVDTKEYIRIQEGELIRHGKRFQCPKCEARKGLSFRQKEGRTIFKCFSCGLYGDALDYEKAKGLSQKDAIEKVCRYAGIESPYQGNHDNIIPDRIIQPKPLPTKPKLKEQEKKSSWPTMPEVLEMIQTQNQSDIQADCEKWVNLRGFGAYNERALEIFSKAVLGVVSFPWYGKQVSYFVIPVYSEPGKLATVQFIGYPHLELDEKTGEAKLKTDKLFARNDTEESKKGVVGIFLDTPVREEIFMVESLTNAISLSCIGLNSMVLFSASNTDLALKLQRLYPDRKLVFWLDKGVEEIQKTAMSKYGLPGIFWSESLTKGYDHNNLIQEKSENEYIAEIAGYLEQLPRPLPEVQEYFEIQQALDCREKSLTVILAGTGTGKTKTIQGLNQGHLARKEKATVFTDTIPNARNIHSGINGAGLLISKSKKEESKEEKQGKLRPKDVNITTYGYLGFDGHYPSVFEIAGHSHIDKYGKEKFVPGLSTAKYCYLDEFHYLFEACRVHYPLCACYVEKKADGGNYWQKMEEWQGWQKYRFAYWPIRMDFKKFEYLSIEKTIEGDNNKAFNDKYKVADLQKPEMYKHLNGTVFGFDLEQKINLTVPVIENRDEKQAEYAYIKSLLSKAYKPRIICEFPLVKATNEPLTQDKVNELFEKAYQEEIIKDNDEEKARDRARVKLHKIITFPKNVAYVPFLTGYNVLPLVQLMTYSKIIHAFTATLSEKQIGLLQEIVSLCGWALNIRKIQAIPFRFPVSILKKKERLDCTEQAEILSGLIEKEAAKALVVAWKKYNAWQICENIKAKGEKYSKEISHFFERVYINGMVDYGAESDDSRKAERHVITYSGASILQGANMPYHQIVFVDCGIFISKASMELTIGATQEEVRRELIAFIRSELLQIVGRVFRPFSEEWQAWESTKQTQVSRKKIVIFLHNIPEELQGFQLNQELIETYQEIAESENYRFFSLLPEKATGSYVESILNAYNGEQPANYRELDAKELAEQKKNREHLGKKQRAEMGDDLKEAKEQEKENALKARMIELKKQGKTWRETYTKLHIARKPREERNSLQLFYESLIE